MQLKRFFNSLLICIVLILSIPLYTYSQNWGMSLGGSVEQVIFGDIFYKSANHYFHLGYSYQITDAKGEEKSERKSNYGLTTSGTGDKFYTVDLIYGYQIINKLELFLELSIGEKKDYTNYIDNRFKDGGYHLITNDESIIGYGFGGSYIISRQFGIFIGFNTIRKLGIGIRYTFTYN